MISGTISIVYHHHCFLQKEAVVNGTSIMLLRCTVILSRYHDNHVYPSFLNLYNRPNNNYLGFYSSLWCKVHSPNCLCPVTCQLPIGANILCDSMWSCLSNPSESDIITNSSTNRKPCWTELDHQCTKTWIYFKATLFRYHDNHIDLLFMQRISCWIQNGNRDVLGYVLSFVDVLVNVFKSLLRLGIRWQNSSLDSTSYGPVSWWLSCTNGEQKKCEVNDCQPF